MANIFDDKTADQSASTPPRALGEQPGGLRSSTRMTIQTRQAQKLVLGRKRSKDVQPIIGLLDFGRRMRLLWLSAQADDPYADWYLLKIEEAIDQAKTVMSEKKQWLDDVLDSMPGFEIDVAQSLQPIQVPIAFQNPYGYMGAYLIADYDALCCSIFTATHIGLIDRSIATNLYSQTGKSIRRTFDLAAKWKFSGATRDDISANSPIAIKAIAIHGECPEPILKKTKRAKIAPEIRVRPKAVKIEVKKKKENVEKIRTAETEKDNKTEMRESLAENLFGMG